MGLVNLFGRMVGRMRGNGKMGKCMGRVCIFGKMEGNIRVIILMIRNMEMGSFIGLMARFSKGFGLTARGRVKVSLFLRMGRRNWGSGKMIREFVGLRVKDIRIIF